MDAKRRKCSKYWTDDETRILIAKWADDRVQRQLDGNVSAKTLAWRTILEKVREKIPDVDLQQIRNKIKKLKKDYDEEAGRLGDDCRLGVPSVFKFFAQMHPILAGRRRRTSPTDESRLSDDESAGGGASGSACAASTSEATPAISVLTEENDNDDNDDNDRASTTIASGSNHRKSIDGDRSTNCADDQSPTKRRLIMTSNKNNGVCYNPYRKRGRRSDRTQPMDNDRQSRHLLDMLARMDEVAAQRMTDLNNEFISSVKELMETQQTMMSLLMTVIAAPAMSFPPTSE